MIKNIIVTGGTDGIGLSLVKKLLERDHSVYIVGKNAEKGNSVLNEIKTQNWIFFNVTFLKKVKLKKLIQILNKIPTIDVLINNAGSIFDNRTLTREGIEKTFALNHLSYMQLSLGLLNKLESSTDPRIVNVSSNAHKRYKIDINDLENKLNYSGWKAYCRSKLLNIFFTYSFKNELNTKINSNCLHPGFVNSNFEIITKIFIDF